MTIRTYARILSLYDDVTAVSVAAQSRACVCGRSPAETMGSNPTGCMDVCLL